VTDNPGKPNDKRQPIARRRRIMKTLTAATPPSGAKVEGSGTTTN
jgi:hypothetical protein